MRDGVRAIETCNMDCGREARKCDLDVRSNYVET